MRSTVVIGVVLGVTMLGGWMLFGPASASSDDAASALPGEDNPFKEATKLGVIAHQRIRESSGLAASLVNPGLLWTHNDSGGGPFLYLLEPDGTHRGTWELENVFAFDWEDMSSYELDGRKWLMVGDIGDNLRRRPLSFIHIVEEPRASEAALKQPLPVQVHQTLRFRFEDGSHDCEALAFDTQMRTILLVTKSYRRSGRQERPDTKVYTLKLPDEPTNQTLVARRIATLPTMIVTAADLSPDNRRLVILTLEHAWLYTRDADEPWARALERDPVEIRMPRRIQGEALCFDRHGRSLYTTTEGLHSPVWRLDPLDEVEENGDGGEG